MGVGIRATGPQKLITWRGDDYSVLLSRLLISPTFPADR